MRFSHHYYFYSYKVNKHAGHMPYFFNKSSFKAFIDVNLVSNPLIFNGLMLNEVWNTLST
jgi:hypothetical protein